MEVYKSSMFHFAPGLSDNAAANVSAMPRNAYWGLYIDGNGPISIMRQLKTEELKYIDGIVVKGTGHKMQPDDRYGVRILRYVQSLERENAALRTEREQLTGEIHNLKIDLKSTIESNNEMSDKIGDLKADKALLETELTRQIDGYRAEVADRENELMKAGTAHDNAQATINGLKARVALLEKTLDRCEVWEHWDDEEVTSYCAVCGGGRGSDNGCIVHKPDCIVLTCKEDKA